VLVDLVLAILHHLAVFVLFAMLAVQLVWLKRDLDLQGLNRVAKLDIVYGATAGAVLLIGVMRVFFGLKGWSYYAESPSFWAKMAAFALIGLMSIPPTMKFVAWRRRAEGELGGLPSAAEIPSVRLYLHVEATIFLAIPIFAAAMARGY